MDGNEPNPSLLLEDIDARQNEVLSELDELNARVEQLLARCLANRLGEKPSSEPISRLRPYEHEAQASG